MPNFFCRPAFTQGEDNAMATRTHPKKKSMNKTKPTTKPVSKVRPAAAAVIEKPVIEKPVIEKPISMAVSPLAAKPKESAKEREARERRREALQQMLLRKRHEILKEIEGSLGQSLTEDQQRRLESARDVGDQALMDLDRELGISLMEMRNRRRQAIDEALTRLNEGTYGICAECGVEISERRLEAVPFAKLCVECQAREELLEKIEKEEERD
jgi:DnaK suppressor protein